MRVISYLFYSLIFLVPLVFFHNSSELFEFNKMILVYTITTLILAAWSVECVRYKKIIFKRTVLDAPLLIFLGSQAISTFLSIDFRTSLLGYYSRFNGGLLSILCYSILYWAFVTFMTKKEVVTFLKVAIYSTVIASIYAVFEHFGRSPSCIPLTGFNVECWVQDVQNRVYGTFGQPNWLAAWLVAILPFILAFSVQYFSQKKRLIYMSTIFLLFALLSILVLYYTKSRSGMLGLATSLSIFFLGSFYYHKSQLKASFVIAGIVLMFVFGVTFFIDTPWKVGSFNQSAPVSSEEQTEFAPPALEVSITPSGDIRKIVWRGAVDIAKKYPLFGSGVETFAYSYYQTRPVEHNMVSEWNFLYNKAHNEYLNILANTGVLGITTYFVFLVFCFVVFLKAKLEDEDNLLRSASIASFSSVLVTNFFGFSVVPVNVVFFLLPAIVISLSNSIDKKNSKHKYTQVDYLLISVILIAAAYLLVTIIRYWMADFDYSSGIKQKKLGNYQYSIQLLEKAHKAFPNETFYLVELSESYSKYAEQLAKSSPENAIQYAALSAKAADRVRELSPYNVKAIKQATNIYADLASINPDFYLKEFETITNLVTIAPTDAAISYRLGVAMARVGQVDNAISQLKKTIDMKPNYKIARRLLAYIYEDQQEIDLAREQYKYILEKIDPNDETVAKDLERVSSN